MTLWGLWDTRIRVVALVSALFCTVPSTAEADGFVTPFVGASFGESDVEKVTTFGVSLAAMAGGVFGFEIDLARTAEAPANTVFVANSRATTVMGNLIIGIPIKGVRPYAVGGLGWVRTEVLPRMDFNLSLVNRMPEKNEGLGFDVGGGIIGFFSEHVGARFDLRYTRSISVGDNFRDIIFEDLAFWRATAGVALRF